MAVGLTLAAVGTGIGLAAGEGGGRLEVADAVTVAPSFESPHARDSGRAASSNNPIKTALDERSRLWQNHHYRHCQLPSCYQLQLRVGR